MKDSLALCILEAGIGIVRRNIELLEAGRLRQCDIQGNDIDQMSNVAKEVSERGSRRFYANDAARWCAVCEMNSVNADVGTDVDDHAIILNEPGALIERVLFKLTGYQ